MIFDLRGLIGSGYNVYFVEPTGTQWRVGKGRQSGNSDASQARTALHHEVGSVCGIAS